MIRVRRHDASPRLELMPLLDVVFLLLTFFIFSFVVMIRADALSVGLSPVTTGAGPGESVIRVLTIDAEGGLIYEGKALEEEDLNPLFEQLANDPENPTLYVSLAVDGNVDRGPLLWSLDEIARRAGLERYVKVGPPTDP